MKTNRSCFIFNESRVRIDDTLDFGDQDCLNPIKIEKDTSVLNSTLRGGISFRTKGKLVTAEAKAKGDFVDWNMKLQQWLVA